MKLIRIVPLICLAASLALFTGCLSDDDTAGDGATGENGGFGDDPALLAIEDDIAEGVSGSAVSLSLEMLTSMTQWSETAPGTAPGTARTSTATWNTAQLAWVIAGDELESGDDISATLNYTYWVQFRVGGVPQQEANDLTDEIEIRADMIWAGTYTPEGSDYVVEFDWVADYDVTGTQHANGTASLVGAGAIDGTSATAWQGTTHNHEQHVTWSHDLDAAAGEACASGTVTGSFSIYDFAATLDGAGGVVTTVSRAGTVIDTDADTYECAGSAGASSGT